MRQAGQERWRCVPNVINERLDVPAGAIRIVLPIREGFVQIENRFVFVESNLVEQDSMAAELLSDPFPVVEPHRDDQVDSIEQVMRQFSLNVVHRVDSPVDQSGTDHGMNALGFRLDAGRLEPIFAFSSTMLAQGILRHHAAKNISRTDEQDSLRHGMLEHLLRDLPSTGRCVSGYNPAHARSDHSNDPHS